MPAVDKIISQYQLLLISIIVFGVAVSLFLAVFCLVKIRKINNRNNAFFKGKNGESLEDSMVEISKNIRLMDEEIQELYNISNKIHGLTLKSIHKIGIVRFNPFNDIGGDQSFSVALLDGKNSGIVISSLHTKENTRVYSKPVIKEESEKYPFTEEEKRAIKIAIQNKSTKV